MFTNKIILITGGTGSWGNTLIKKLLLENPKEIRIFSRGEQKQVELQRSYNNKRLKYIIGDVRDLDALNAACDKVNFVFHLAALKHVPICEAQPLEALKTNITGTENVIKACLNNKVERAIYVSTDKAVDALNFYGMTKSIGERLMIQANQLSTTTHFVCIRSGNVLGSNGSVIPLFMKQIENDMPITLTHRAMTRYFITLDQAIDLLLKGVKASIGGEIFVMRMPSYRIKDIAEVLVQLSGKKNIPIIETGIRSGEKLHEVLISRNEILHTYHYDSSYYVILPTLEIAGLNEYYEKKHLQKVNFTEYTSNDQVESKEKVKFLLQKAGFINLEELQQID